MNKSVITICSALALAGAISAATPAAQTSAPDPKLVAKGRDIFTTVKCTKCHLAEGQGNKNGHQLDGINAKLTADDVRKWITNPTVQTAKLKEQPDQPMKKIDLKPAEVDALVAYVMSLKK
jgi:mono/diheme cytochrome c family protein